MLPKKCIVDTNVPKTANLSIAPATIPDELVDCVSCCIQIIEHVVKNGGLVLDADDEIFDDYRKQLSLRGQPGIGDLFVKWVHDHHWKFPEQDRVSITKRADTYVEFPQHHGWKEFDPSDLKFVAVANAHEQKPPIQQATDSKWWGWKEALAEVGITVTFLCEAYIVVKCHDKYA